MYNLEIKKKDHYKILLLVGLIFLFMTVITQAPIWTFGFFVCFFLANRAYSKAKKAGQL